MSKVRMRLDFAEKVRSRGSWGKHSKGKKRLAGNRKSTYVLKTNLARLKGISPRRRKKKAANFKKNSKEDLLIEH